MARADRRSVKRSRTHAAERSHQRDSDLRAIEDTMFFTRLRGHAKWMFVFLALVFGVGFVGFGIGANQNASIGDLLRGGGGTSAATASPSSDAREQVKKNPKSAQAQRDALDRAPGGRPDRRGDRRAEPLPRAQAEGHGRATGARRPPPRSCDTRSREMRRRLRRARAISSSTLLSPRRSNLGKGATLGHRPDRAGDLDGGEPGGHQGVHGRADGVPEGRGDVRQARRGRPEGSERPARARARRRSRAATPRRRSPPTRSS